MTRTELERLKLEELERHDREQERIGKIGNVVGAVSSVSSLGSAAGSIARGLGALRAKGAPKGDTTITHNHYHFNKERKH